jgi:hemerythrin-like metal-binding protein
MPVGEGVVKDLVWSNTLSVYVDDIDGDHRRLIDLFNLFIHAVADAESPEYQEAVLEELIGATAWHFRHEERLMVKYGYPDYAAHGQEHEELIAGAGELRQKFLAAERQASGEDVEVLEHWLVAHILATDMKLGDFLVDAM